MAASVKNGISHRYKALVALREHLLADPPSPEQPSASSWDRADSQTGQ